jgi:transcriptional regulator with XRE-family HTH domain
VKRKAKATTSTPDLLTAIFAANVAHHRRRCGFTLAEVAKRTAREVNARGYDLGALNTSYILLLEQGKRSPSLETVRRLAAALGVNVCTILTPREEVRED